MRKLLIVLFLLFIFSFSVMGFVQLSDQSPDQGKQIEQETVTDPTSESFSYK